MEQWRLRGNSALPWADSILLCRCDQEQISGELFLICLFPSLSLSSYSYLLSPKVVSYRIMTQKRLSDNLPGLAFFYSICEKEEEHFIL